MSVSSGLKKNERMAEEELISTSVSVCGRSYPIRVREGEVALIQSVAKMINEKIREFQSTYKKRDLQDCMAMTLLTYAMENAETSKSSVNDDFRNQLNALNSYLDRQLA